MFVCVYVVQTILHKCVATAQEVFRVDVDQKVTQLQENVTSSMTEQLETSTKQTKAMMAEIQQLKALMKTSQDSLMVKFNNVKVGLEKDFEEQSTLMTRKQAELDAKCQTGTRLRHRL
jgi:hypothetical protein